MPKLEKPEFMRREAMKRITRTDSPHVVHRLEHLLRAVQTIYVDELNAAWERYAEKPASKSADLDD